MSRALLLSLLLHSLLIVATYTLLSKQSSNPKQSFKTISLATITIAKPHHKIEQNKPKQLEKKVNTKRVKREEKERTKPIIKKKGSTTKSPHKGLLKKRKIAIKKKRVKSNPKSNKRAKSTKQLHKEKKYQISKKKRIVSKKVSKGRRKRVSKSSSMQKKVVATPKRSKQIEKASTYPNIKAKIYQAINRVKIYPRAAKRVGAQGSVNTCFTLGANRSVSNITTQGAHPLLQKGARATIQKAKEYFPNIPNPRHLCVTISYVLD